MRLVSAVKTDVGKKRKQNEDSFLVDERRGLFGVADGMGGRAAGEVASQEALEALRDSVLGQIQVIERQAVFPSASNNEAVRRLLEFSVRAATYQVFGMSEVDSSRKGMGTTLSLLLLQPAFGFIAHVGDSRIYRIRGERSELMTTDHTYVNALVEEGRLTPEQARRSRYSNVLLRAVGSKDYVEVETKTFQHIPGDTFLLCSDGLYRYLKDGELPGLVNRRDPQACVNRLVDLANQCGGRDNITAVLVRIDP